MPSYTFTPLILRGAGTRAVPEIPAGSSFPNAFSLSFDGTDDRVELDSNLNSSTNNVSISSWMKSSESVVYNDIRIPFGARPTSGGSNYAIGRIRSQFATPTELNVALFNTFGTTVLNDGNWHNLVYTFNHTSKEVKAYVDGNTTPEVTTTFPSYILNYQFSVGADPLLSAFFNGNVDECAIFYSVLSTSDITSIYGTGVPNDISSLNPVAWYRFEEGSGTTAIDSGTGGNNGTINGATYSTNVPT